VFHPLSRQADCSISASTIVACTNGLAPRLEEGQNEGTTRQALAGRWQSVSPRGGSARLMLYARSARPLRRRRTRGSACARMYSSVHDVGPKRSGASGLGRVFPRPAGVDPATRSNLRSCSKTGEGKRMNLCQEQLDAPRMASLHV